VIKLKKRVSVHKTSGNKFEKKAVVVAPVKAIVAVPEPAKVAAPAPGQIKVVASPPIVKKHSLYIDVTPDKYFVLCDGRKIKNAKELADILQLISDDMYKYHVTDSKNDFSNWINDVFGEFELAKKMRPVRNRLEMSIEIYRNMFDKLDKLEKSNH
jgi:hypothetical protein